MSQNISFYLMCIVAIKLKKQETESEDLSSFSLIRRHEQLQEELNNELTQRFSKTSNKMFSHVRPFEQVQNSNVLTNESFASGTSYSDSSRIKSDNYTDISRLPRIQASTDIENDELPVTVSTFLPARDKETEHQNNEGTVNPQRRHHSVPTPQITVGFVNNIHGRPRNTSLWTNNQK